MAGRLRITCASLGTFQTLVGGLILGGSWRRRVGDPSIQTVTQNRTRMIFMTGSLVP